MLGDVRKGVAHRRGISMSNVKMEFHQIVAFCSSCLLPVTTSRVSSLGTITSSQYCYDSARLYVDLNHARES